MTSINPHFRKIILTVTFVIAAIGMASAQDVTVSFPAGEMTVERSFRRIRTQTGYRFSYSNKYLDTRRTVRFTGSAMPLGEAMEHILAGSGFHHAIQGRFILIMKDETPSVQRSALPGTRGDEVYALTDVEAHRNVNRCRPAPAPTIRMEDTVRVVADRVRSTNTDDYTSYSVPIESYTNNCLPRYALKMNLLHGLATLTPNIGIEFGLGQRTSLEVHAAINPWRLQSKLGDNKKLAHLFIRPEFRYWTCERMNGHFFGVHAFFAHYNVGSHDIPLLFDKEYRYDGYAVGGGVTYGYFLPFNKRWGMEFNIGLGAMWMDYDRFSCEGCEKSAEPKTKTYFGPTRAGITLVFNIK